MTTTRRSTYPHIVRIPGVVGGEPTIKGTRVPVRSIAVLHRYEDIDSICQAYPSVGRAEIEEALDYYLDHQQEIDRDIKENDDIANAYNEDA